jgi:hypothetical protein
MLGYSPLHTFNESPVKSQFLYKTGHSFSYEF